MFDPAIVTSALGPLIPLKAVTIMEVLLSTAICHRVSLVPLTVSTSTFT